MTKVLIVEDEPPISNLIRLSLTKNGYACKCVFDGMEAADFLEKERTDLILLDVMLPKLDGFTVLRRLRDGADLSANPGQVAGWLCAGMFLRP